MTTSSGETVFRGTWYEAGLGYEYPDGTVNPPYGPIELILVRLLFSRSFRAISSHSVQSSDGQSFSGRWAYAGQTFEECANNPNEDGCEWGTQTRISSSSPPNTQCWFYDPPLSTEVVFLFFSCFS
jgi:hypothetical protein